jgi:hypothetical protein
MALYTKTGDTAFPTSPVFTAWKAPLPVDKVNTAVTLSGVTPNGRSFSIDLGNDVQYRNLFNQEDVVIVDRRVVGTISFEQPAVATKDWMDIAEKGTSFALSLVHGTTAGAFVQVTADRLQMVNPRYSDQQGVRFIDAELVFVPNAGSDDISVIAR